MQKTILPLVILCGLLLGTSLYGQSFSGGTLDLGISQGNGGTPTVSSGSDALKLAGSGMIILSGSNTYGGTTTISSGTLQVGAGGSGGTPVLTGSNTNAGTISGGTISVGTLSIVDSSIVGNAALVSNTPVPEPSGLAFLALGAGGFLALRKGTGVSAQRAVAGIGVKSLGLGR